MSTIPPPSLQNPFPLKNPDTNKTAQSHGHSYTVPSCNPPPYGMGTNSL